MARGRARSPGLKLALLAVLLAAASTGVLRARAAFAPNHFLGTCLTEEWVASVEAQLGVSSTERDRLNRLVHPFLREASKYPRYKLNDPRTSESNIFSPECMVAQTNPAIYGVGAQLDANGKLVSKGKIDNTLVIEMNYWTSHEIVSHLLAILAAEVYGYEVSMFYIASGLDITQRMSSVRTGQCTPTHVNMEVWRPGKELMLDRYVNESRLAGSVGYDGRTGLYTTKDFVQEYRNATKYPGGPYFGAYWEGYTVHDALIDALPLSRLTSNPAFYPPAETGCADGSYGCLNHCSKSAACTARESAGKDCLVVIMMYDFYDPGYLQAAMANNGIPAYFCFLGYDGATEYVLFAQKNKIPVLFIMWEPSLFLSTSAELFERVFLPQPLPERVALATGTFGENGYGKDSTNPVDVDFPPTTVVKYMSTVLTSLNEDGPISSLVSKISVSTLHINDMLRKQTTFPKHADQPTPEFQAACKWLKENYNVWKLWLDRLPLCAFDKHIQYKVSGCESKNTSSSKASAATGHRTITFSWKDPDPNNSSLPYACDGGLTEYPPPIKTSRSCEWILTDTSKWIGWISSKPTCDTTFYTYEVSDCDAKSKRTVRYHWLLPDPADPSKSLECDVSSMTLPDDVAVDCEFLPFSTSLFHAVAAIASVLIGVLVCAMIFVFVNRKAPIIKRSQFELLLLMIVGGILVCLSALVYAGEPSDLLCAARPSLISTGFTTIFGALFVKSLRVYRVFMKSAMKRVTITTVMMVKVLSVFYAVDFLIIGVWFGADFPKPTATEERAREFQGTVIRIACQSESFIFSALLMFWKAIVLFLGIYTSFLIRNVSADFQESIWIFSSSVMVLVGCLVILPLAYLVDMSAEPFYAFLASSLLLCTAVVMGLMLSPKVLRLHAQSTSSSRSSKYSSATMATPSSRTGSVIASSSTQLRQGESDATSGDTTTTGRLRSATALVRPLPES